MPGKEQTEEPVISSQVVCGYPEAIYVDLPLLCRDIRLFGVSSFHRRPGQSIPPRALLVHETGKGYDCGKHFIDIKGTNDIMCHAGDKRTKTGHKCVQQQTIAPQVWCNGISGDSVVAQYIQYGAHRAIRSAISLLYSLVAVASAILCSLPFISPPSLVVSTVSLFPPARSSLSCFSYTSKP